MRIRSVMAACLCAAMIPVSPAAAMSAASSDCFASQKVYTLTVQTKWSKKVYKVGEKAKVTVTVTRPGEADPMGYGFAMPPEIPPQPVEGALVTSFMENVFPLVGGYEYTDADGIAKIAFKVNERVRGWRSVVTRASTYHATGLPNDCADVEEEGFRYEPRAFKVE